MVTGLLHYLTDMAIVFKEEGHVYESNDKTK